MDVTQADVVVAGGRGVGGPEGFRRLEALAGVLAGTVAASRPAVDARWSTASRQIGSSGKIVAPRLYVACGISGAGQHLVGMRQSQTIVVLNRDPHAPIVPLADLALVGDANEVLPATLARLERLAPPGGADEAPAAGEAHSASFEGTGPGHDVTCIAVCLSRSPDPEVAFDPRDADAVARVPRTIGPTDLFALEEGLALRQRFPNSRVVALHMGPPEGVEVLRQALAMGADEALLLWDEAFAGSDTLCTARVLAAAARRLKASIVLCGSRGGDGDTGQVPIQLGELMDAAAVNNTIDISPENNGCLSVRRRLEGGRRALIRCSLPAVLGVEAGINRPRYPTLRDRLAARERPIERLDRQALGLAAGAVGSGGSTIQVLNVGPPKPVTPSVSAREEELTAEDRLQQILGGGALTGGGSREDETKVVQGSADLLADAFVRFLLDRGFVKGEPAGR
jgi:electron transfer flavoprotein alpha subunit